MNPNIIIHDVTCTLGAAATIAWLHQRGENAALHKLCDEKDADIRRLRALLKSCGEAKKAIIAAGNDHRRVRDETIATLTESCQNLHAAYRREGRASVDHRCGLSGRDGPIP